MSGTTESLSRRLSTARDLAAVVRSMKALAASSIGQYERAVESLHDYQRTIELGLSACLRQMACAPDVGAERPGRAIGAILFGSDQGLVGRFNEILLESAIAKLRSLPGTLERIWTVGERMQSLAAGAGPGGGSLPVPRLLPVPNSVEAIAPLVGRILVDVEAEAERGQGAAVEIYVFHNRPRSAAAYDPCCRRLLPLDAAWRRDSAAPPWPTRDSPQVMDALAPALAALIREYLFVVLFQACAESLASENASRLAAMQRAEKNIRDIIDQLSGKYHRLRQETIDEELFEVVAGYESLLQGQKRHRARV